MRRLFNTFSLLLLSFFTINAQNVQQTKAKGRPTIAVVLAGGGAKGTAHIGALKVIEACGIPIDIVVGTSIGSIVGGLYSIGYNTQELEDITKGSDWINLILDTPDYGNRFLTSKKDQESYFLRISLDRTRMLSSTGTGGLIYGKNVSALFHHLTEGVPRDIKFNEFPITFACVATDAVSGEKYVFHEGNLVTAMRSSMAIPSVFTPVRVGKKALVDGFVVDNFPVDVARELGADIVIGVDLVNEISDDEAANSAIDIMMRLMDLHSKELYQQNIKDTDIYLKVNTTGYSAASFNTTAVDSLINRGVDAGMKNLDKLTDLAHRLNINPSEKEYYHPRMEGVKYYHTLHDIRDIDRSEAEMLAQAEDSARVNDSNQKMSDKTKNIIERIFGSTSLKAGARFDNQQYAAVHFDIDLHLLKSRRLNTSLYSRLGNRFVGSASVGYLFYSGAKVEGGYEFERKPLDIDFKGRNILDIISLGNSLYAQYQQVWRNVAYSFGARYRSYTFDKLKSNLYTDEEEELINEDAVIVDRFIGIKKILTPSGISYKVEPKHEQYISFYAKAEYNSLNSLYFPTKGTQVEGSFESVDNNFDSIQSKSPIFIVSGLWRTAIPMGKKFTMIPRVQGRIIFENELTTPASLMNFVGGLHREYWMPHQLDVAGMPDLETRLDNVALVAGFDLQYRIYKIHYITASADASTFFDNIKNIFDKSNFGWGVNFGYQMKTIIGPVSLMGMYSSHTKKGAAVLNIGYYF